MSDLREEGKTDSRDLFSSALTNTSLKRTSRSASVLCMEEQSICKEEVLPTARIKSHLDHVVYEYESAGVTNVFVFAEPCRLAKI